MKNISVKINGRELTEFKPSISFMNNSFPKDSIITINGQKYKLLQDITIVAEQIED